MWGIPPGVEVVFSRCNVVVTRRLTAGQRGNGWPHSLTFNLPFPMSLSPSFLSRLGGRALLITCALGVGSTLVFAGPSPRRQASARTLMKSYTAEPMAADELRVTERAFLAKAIESTRQQMRLAEVGAGRADSSDVRSHALQLANDYRALHETLDVLIRRKGGLADAPVGGTSETYQRLSEKSGADFDREFVRTVAASSNAVMTLFENAAADAKDADVRDLAASELPVLRAHRNTVADLKKTFD